MRRANRLRGALLLLAMSCATATFVVAVPNGGVSSGSMAFFTVVPPRFLPQSAPSSISGVRCSPFRRGTLTTIAAASAAAEPSTVVSEKKSPADDDSTAEPVVAVEMVASNKAATVPGATTNNAASAIAASPSSGSTEAVKVASANEKVAEAMSATTEQASKKIEIIVVPPSPNTAVSSNSVGERNASIIGLVAGIAPFVVIPAFALASVRGALSRTRTRRGEILANIDANGDGAGENAAEGEAETDETEMIRALGFLGVSLGALGLALTASSG